jgi:LemA protein
VILEVIITVFVITAILCIISWWFRTFNMFIGYKNFLENQFAEIDVVMERRIKMLPALAQVAQKYHIHEYSTIKDTIEARGNWTKGENLAEKSVSMGTAETNMLKIQAIFEKYPILKADKLYQQIMGNGDISEVEKELQLFRRRYNHITNIYNTRRQLFPGSIVADFYNFTAAPYLKLGNSINQGAHEEYNPRLIFEDGGKDVGNKIQANEEIYSGEHTNKDQM